MGSRTDVLKLVSSLTLFGHVARELHEAQPDVVQKAVAEAAETVLRAAEAQAYPRCAYTLDLLSPR